MVYFCCLFRGEFMNIRVSDEFIKKLKGNEKNIKLVELKKH